jgi:hypothetical protein
MVNYVRTENGLWHRVSCPDIRRPDIDAQAETLPEDREYCSACAPAAPD